jgi:hypothetical protein
VRRSLSAALLFALLAACPSKGPAGFSGGAEDRWTLPLVGALEDGLLVTPVTIGTLGPFLFALDPDAPISVIDGDLAKTLGLRASAGPAPYDESGTQQQRVYVEMRGLEVGTLIIEKRRALVVKPNTFDAAGRRIHGVLGYDVLGAVVFGFDRDLGVATLIDPTSFKPPAGAIEIPYQVVGKNLPVVGRRVAKAMIGDEQFDLHLDLGSTVSQLRDTEWGRAKLVSRDIKAGAVDEVGTVRLIEKASEPAPVKIGTASGKVVFVPYADQRWADHELAGTLGLGFFARYDVWASFAAKTYFLVPREGLPLANRIGRWETGPLAKCASPGCVTVRVIDPLAGKPLEEGKPHPGVILSLTREERAGGMPLEVVLEVPQRPDLPHVIANLPPHVDRLIDQLPPAFAGLTLAVVDASPYPRDCPNKNGCVDKLAR